MEYSTSAILVAFLLTLLAGLSTGIGSLIALLKKDFSKNWLIIALGFSAGVMIFVAFVEIMHASRELFTEVYGHHASPWYQMGAFFAGIALIMIIDKFVPNFENPHEPHFEMSDYDQEHKKDMAKLKKMGVLTALAIGIHNFPEGMAVFSSALVNPEIGISIAVAIALHNIPEGIAVSVPIYYATGSKKKAFWLSFLSGLAEPVGALIGYAILSTYMSDSLIGWVLGMTAGIMVFISIDELLPTAQKYDTGHKAIYSMLAGMAVMGTSLALLGGSCNH